MPSTITVSRELKEELRRYKGHKSWEEFLREVVEILAALRRERAKEKAKILYELVDLEEVERGFRLRDYETRGYRCSD
ncbi:MAG: hypothetical protein GXO66_01735 [Euryarchaeota archaeon]|nr:hypothetical protein [Euryarchaeota archaeon]